MDRFDPRNRRSASPADEGPVPVNILAFDAAAAACSAFLLRDGAAAGHEWQAMTRGHAEALVPMIERVMGDLPYASLDAIGVTIGPGAFTGLRIALATARGLALATRVPVHGVTSFAVAVHQAGQGWHVAADRLVVALETKRADLYLQAFDTAGAPLGDPASVLPDAVAGWLPAGVRRIAVAGDAADRLIAALPAGTGVHTVAGAALPDAASVAALVAARLATSPPPAAGPGTLRPLYLRPPDVTVPKPGPRRRT